MVQHDIMTRGFTQVYICSQPLKVILLPWARLSVRLAYLTGKEKGMEGIERLEDIRGEVMP